MGLDMYLSAKRYLWQKDDEEFIKVIKAERLEGMGDMQVKEITCRAGYWRKANAIHKWFVDNVQEGADDCREYEVPDEKLAELANLCRHVLKERGEATEKLPPCEGFFFGKSEIDDYYWEYLQDTAEQIEKLLSVEGINRWTFVYQSSW
jgi:hypothetical protein